MCDEVKGEDLHLVFPDKDTELCRQLLLNQLDPILLYFRYDSDIRAFMVELTYISGSNPAKDAKILLHKWMVTCFLNKYDNNNINSIPDVPIDFSSIHPEFTDKDIIVSYAQSSAENLMRLYESFPYEFIKTIKGMKSPYSQYFGVGLLFNIDIPLHFSGRLISYFPISTTPIDFSALYEKRCKSFSDISEFFEGLLCNVSSKQINTAQFLALHFDSLLLDELIQLINTSIRSLSHFIDENLALIIRQFDEATLIPFLLQISTSFVSLSKTLKFLHSHPIVDRYKNQLKLMQICGLGDDWQRLQSYSVPVILTPDHIFPEVLTDIPRNSLFVTVQSSEWEMDYDFMQCFLALSGIYKQRFFEFPDFIDIDIFSSLFLKDHINFSTVERVVMNLLQRPNLSTELRPYVERAASKISLVKVLFRTPTYESLFYPASYYFYSSLDSLFKINKVISVYNDIPKQVSTRIFTYQVVEALHYKQQESTDALIFHSPAGKPLDSNTLSTIHSILDNFDPSIRDQLLIEFIASYREFSGLSGEISDDKYTEFLKRMKTKFDTSLNVDLAIRCSITEFQKKLGVIMSKHINDKLLRTFSAYLIQLLASSTQHYGMAYQLFATKPEDWIANMLNTYESFDDAQLNFQDTSIDLIRALFTQNKPQRIKPNILNQMLKKSLLPTIAYVSDSFSPKEILKLTNDSRFKIFNNYITKFKSNKGKIIFSKPPSVNLDQILDKLKVSKDQNEIMITLDDLLYQYNLESHFDTILMIIENLPKDFCASYLEAFISVLPNDSFALIPLYQKLMQLKPQNNNIDNSSEEQKVKANWDYIIKLIPKYDEIISSPEKIYHLSHIHLRQHMIGHSIVNMVLNFTRFLVFERETKFLSKSDETTFLKKHLKNGLSNLTDDKLKKLIIDFALIDEFKYYGDFLKMFNKMDFSSEIKGNLPRSAKLIPFVNNEKLIDDILKIQKVSSIEDEVKCLHLMMKMKSYSSDNHIWKVLNLFSHNGYFSRTLHPYSGESLTLLYDNAILFDIDVSMFDQVSISKSIKEQIENNTKAFGFATKPENVDLINLFTLEGLQFTPSIPNLPAESTVSPLYCLESKQNSLSMMKIPLDSYQQPNLYFPPDYCFYELEQNPFINTNIDAAITDTISFASMKSEPKEKIDLSVEILNDHISKASLVELFDRLDFNSLHEIIAMFNAHNCIHALLLCVIYVLDHPDLMRVFVFDDNKTLDDKDLFRFVLSTKQALISASRLSNRIDPSLLFPTSILLNSNRRDLDDLCIVLEYQNQIDISLFESHSSKTNIITKIFAQSDYDRGFKLAHALHVDMDEVMIEAASVFAQRSNKELGTFLFNVIPHISIDTANHLIEALATIISKDKVNQPLYKLLLSGINDTKHSYEMLKWFGFNDTTAMYALLNGLNEEIFDSLKEARKQNLIQIIRKCNNWLTFHHIQH